MAPPSRGTADSPRGLGISRLGDELGVCVGEARPTGARGPKGATAGGSRCRGTGGVAAVAAARRGEHSRSPRWPPRVHEL
jgi:hypothetical protein